MYFRQSSTILLLISSALVSTTASADVAISEVMANTTSGYNDSDEYIELCNPDGSDVDVAGYVINDGDDVDALVAWSTWTDSDGDSLASLGDSSLVEDTTVIPAGGCALILDPDYISEDSTQPYDIEPGTIILTVESGTAIGGAPGLGATDPITLYGTGGTTAADVIDTYGTPISDDDPGACDDDEADGIPLDPDDGRSSSRVDLSGVDEESNWIDSAPSPGFRSAVGTYEVSADGSADYLTISDAIRVAAAGSEILVHAGYYEEDVVYTEGVSITSVEGAESTYIVGSVTIDGVGGSPVLSGFTVDFGITVSSVDSEVSNNFLVDQTLVWHYANGTISGNSFSGGEQGIALDYYASPEISDNTFTLQTDASIYCTIGSAPHIIGNTISDVEGAGIDCSSEPTIEANYIEGCANGINLTGDAQVFGNTVMSCGNGIRAYDSGPNIYANTLTYNDIGIFFEDSAGTAHSNLVSENGFGIMVNGGITDFIYSEISATPDVLHNTVVNNPGDGIAIGEGSGTLVKKSELYLVAGNIVSGSDNGIVAASDWIDVVYNDSVGNATADYVLGAAGDLEADASNISEDPLFTDVTTADHTLLTGSPCIDSGYDTEFDGTDYDGAERVVDGDGDEIAIADMGAFEFSDYCPDADADGYQDDCGQEGDVDCDDTDDTVNPGATETWYDGVDQDCDGNDDDQDGDGFPLNNDCDDTDSTLTTDCDEDEGGDGGLVDEETGKDEGTGCGCSNVSRPAQGLPWLAVLGLVGIARRRRGIS